MCQHHLRIGKQKLSGVKHICCFYSSSEELESVFLPYLHQGLEKEERVLCIFPEGVHAAFRQKLAERGANVEAGQMEVHNEDETYLAGGSFAKNRMAGLLKDYLEGARKSPRPQVRTLGEMSWALRNLPGTDELAEYECMVNDLCDEYGCVLACAYDVNKFNGRVLADAFATHSHIVLNGTIHENPHYLPPQESLHHVARRKSGPGKVRPDDN